MFCWTYDRFSRCASPSAFVLCCQSWADREANQHMHHDSSGHRWPIYQPLWAWLPCWHCWNCHQESITGVSERLERHSQMARRVGGGDLVAQMQESVQCWVLPGLFSWSAQHRRDSSCSTVSAPLDIFAQCFAVMTECLGVFILLASPEHSWLKAYFVFA